MTCELLQRSYEGSPAIEPDGAVIDGAELEAHYDEGRFPGHRCATQPTRQIRWRHEIQEFRRG